jgi:Flp pilus assembly pilin Flp
MVQIEYAATAVVISQFMTTAVQLIGDYVAATFIPVNPTILSPNLWIIPQKSYRADYCSPLQNYRISMCYAPAPTKFSF